MGRTDIEIGTWPFSCDGGVPGGPNESFAIISLDMPNTEVGAFDVAPDGGSRGMLLSSSDGGLWSPAGSMRGRVTILRNTATSIDALLDLQGEDGGPIKGVLHAPKCGSQK